MLAVNKKIPIFAVQHGAISSVGRAPDCGSGCRGFEPHIAPQLKREDDRQVFVILCFFYATLGGIRGLLCFMGFVNT